MRQYKVESASAGPDNVEVDTTALGLGLAAVDSTETAKEGALTTAPATIPEEPEEHWDQCTRDMGAFLASTDA